MATLPLDVIIRAVDRLTGPVRRISERLNRLTEPARRVANGFRALTEAAGVGRLVEGFRGVGTALGRIQGQMRGVAQSFVALLAAGGGLAFAFQRLFIAPAAQFERFRIMLTSIEGSSDKAERALAWIEKFAVETPLGLTDVTDAFIQLRVFGLDPMDGTLQALVDQNAKMGGSADRLKGIILAVGQAWQKQKLQGEEALQLIERGVPVWDLLAKRVGKSTAELQKASAAGLLGRNAIRALVEEIGKSSAGAAQEQMVSWDGMVSNMMDLWERFRRMVMDAGPFAFLKEQIQGLLATVDAMDASGELKRLADDIGGRIVEGLRALVEVGRRLPEILDRIGRAFRRVRDVLQPLADLLGGWPELIAAIAGVVVFGPLVGGLASLTAAIVSLGAAMIATPIGWFLGGLALLGAAAVLLVDDWRPVGKFFADLFGGLRDSFGGFIDMVQGLADLDLSRAMEGVRRWYRGTNGFWNTALGLSSASAARPMLGATAAAPAATGGGGGWGEGRITVDFRHVPPGARVQMDPYGSAPLDLAVGYNMLGAR